MKPKKPRCKLADLLALHEAFQPLADACLETMARAYEIAKASGFKNRDSLKVIDLTVETLQAINKVMEQAERRKP
jgi:hypothetical protein